MSTSAAFAHAQLLLIFHGTPIANLADNAASSPATTLTVALHTADPGPGGTMATNECAYPAYARTTTARSSVDWTVTANVVSPVTPIAFPTMTAGAGETATHWSIGSGVGDDLILSGPLDPYIVITAGVPPRVMETSTITVLTAD